MFRHDACSSRLRTNALVAIQQSGSRDGSGAEDSGGVAERESDDAQLALLPPWIVPKSPR